MRRKGIITVFVLLTSLSQLYSLQKKMRTVAVLDFTNEQKSPGLDYLRQSLPESISASLSKSADVQVVERRNLSAVLKEAELAQLGVTDTEEIQKAGRLAKADVLILGSFSGKPDSIRLTMKAVESSTGKVIDGKNVSASLGDLFDKSAQAVLGMAGVISGKRLGTITISTNPEGAEIFLDGNSIGESPVIEHKISAGEHRIFITKMGYTEQEYTVSVKPGENVKWSANLPEKRKAQLIILAFSFHRVFSDNSALKPSNLYLPQVGLSFGKITAYFELGLSAWDHSYTYESAFGVPLTQERKYSVTLLVLGVNYEPFEHWTYVSPYVGAFIGGMLATDYRRKYLASEGETGDEQVKQAFLGILGLRAGLEIMPKNRISIFLEGRYSYVPQEVIRPIDESQGLLGGLVSKDTTLQLNSYTFGGGIKFSF